MAEPYQKEFARFYDLLYSDKNYELECDLIESAVRLYALGKPSSILDAGCGSGGHAIELAKRGYKVWGIDRSEGLLARAQERASLEHVEINFHNADLRSFDLRCKADLCISMFAVLSFQLSNGDVQQVLKQIRNHLEPGGLLICDVWHGPAVLLQRPEKRLKIARKDGLRLYRFAEPRLSVMEHTNEVKQHVLVINEADQRLVDEVVESQVVRFFFPQELTFHLEVAGFDVLKLFAFPHLERDASENDWELGFVARARE
jgi:SAM-dependent methyltransferase